MAAVGKNDQTAFPALPACPQASWKRSFGIIALCLALWWVPILAVGAWLGWESTAFPQGVFFSKAAMVTFGGAYAVLPVCGPAGGGEIMAGFRIRR